MVSYKWSIVTNPLFRIDTEIHDVIYQICIYIPVVNALNIVLGVLLGGM